MKSRKKIIFNGVFLAVVFALTIYGVFHGEDLSSMMDAIHHYLVYDAFQRDPSEKKTLLSVFVCRILFQLYHTICQRRTAHADLLYEKREDFHSGVNGDPDDRDDYL